MLLVKTRIGPSTIDGIGLFAEEFIPQGTRVWQWVEGFDLRISAEGLHQLSPPALEIFLRYSFLSKRSGLYVLCFDNARFLNHSDAPNLLDISGSDSVEGLDISARDIMPGEELTTDYREFDEETVHKLRAVINFKNARAR